MALNHRWETLTFAPYSQYCQEVLAHDPVIAQDDDRVMRVVMVAPQFVIVNCDLPRNEAWEMMKEGALHGLG